LVIFIKKRGYSRRVAVASVIMGGRETARGGDRDEKRHDIEQENSDKTGKLGCRLALTCVRKKLFAAQQKGGQKPRRTKKKSRKDEPKRNWNCEKIEKNSCC
jgi:hypothetical protein